MKKGSFFLLLLCICLIIMAGCGAGRGIEMKSTEGTEERKTAEETENTGENRQTDELIIYFFHDTACGSCDGTEEFRKIISEQIYPYEKARPYRLNVKNIFKSEERRRVEELLAEQGITIQEVSFPMMMINGKIYKGLEEIAANIQREYFAGMVVEAIYFYREECQECIDLSAFMDSLPETVKVGSVSLPVVLQRLNSREGDNGDRIRELFDTYQVPEEDQMVPIVFVGSNYLAGAGDIEEKLIQYLEAGDGLKLLKK